MLLKYEQKCNDQTVLLLLRNKKKKAALCCLVFTLAKEQSFLKNFKELLGSYMKCLLSVAEMILSLTSLS